MQLLQHFRQFIQLEHLFQSKDKLLLAVSGGMDSVVLCELCRQAGYNFMIAHCNFQLRGAESDRDEHFVRGLAEKYNVPVFVKRFDTETYSQQHKCSTQVAARELRYNWFNELTNKTTNHKPETTNQPPTYIVTAHHADDNIETLLMNFFKGTGVKGLRGILPKQRNIVRPLLCFTKGSLEVFAEECRLQWVEDSSNATDNYTRNAVRHKVLPAIREVYPYVDASLVSHLERFREVEYLYRQSIETIRKNLVEKKGEELHVPILKLQRTNAARTVLFELIQPFGFTPKQVEEALQLMDSETGKYVASSSHRIFKNRNWLIIAPNATTAAQHILIEQGTENVTFAGGTINLKTTNPKQTSNFQPPTSNTVCLDASAINFPLLLRRWKPGDYFYPLGMRKKKKLARFFIDQKFSATDKEKVWVLEMDKKILWVVGLRMDDRFRITDNTKQVLELTFKSSAAV